jgi:hypothetical protein
LNGATLVLPYRKPGEGGEIFVQGLDADGGRFTIESAALSVDTPSRGLLRFPVPRLAAYQAGVH